MIREYIIKADDTKTDIMGGTPLEEPPKELVRCKDCKYRRKDGFCCFFGVTNPDFYCKCGTRKEGDGDGT